MKVRKIGKSYKVVSNYRMPHVKHCSFKVLALSASGNEVRL